MNKGESEQHRGREGRSRRQHHFSISETSDCTQLPAAFLKENGDRALISSHLHKQQKWVYLQQASWICTSTLNSHLPREASAPT